MKIKINAILRGADITADIGDVIDVDRNIAENLIKNEVASEVIEVIEVIEKNDVIENIENSELFETADNIDLTESIETIEKVDEKKSKSRRLKYES